MSRNEREGRFAGVAAGKPVRFRSRLFRTVRSAKARTVMRGRWVKRSGRPFTMLHFAEQGAQ